jgi:mono/diheme cytochrome c family protein
MNQSWVRAVALVAVALLLAGVAAAVGLRLASNKELSPGRLLYLSYCGTCHGANLEGQPNWQSRDDRGRLPAPPHDATGHTWHHSDRQLRAIVMDGFEAIAPGYSTDMPAFGDVLSAAEFDLILEYLRSSWPERERAYQAERTRRDATGG